jgi:hypothetical protein
MPQGLPTNITSEELAHLIAGVEERVVVALPSIHVIVAEAICQRMDQLAGRVAVLIDPTEAVYRLGFGTLPAVELLQSRGVPVLRREGLRLGCVLLDDLAFFLAPTAQLVEAESELSAPRINVVVVATAEAEIYLRAIAEHPVLVHALAGPGKPMQSEPKADLIHPEELKIVKQALADAPPANFALARQTLVFQPYLQYVELEVQGCNIGRRTIQVPEAVLPITQRDQLDTKLKSSLTLFGRGVEEAFFPVHNRVKRIRKTLIRSLGEPYGNVILRADRVQLDKEIQATQDELTKLKTQVSAGLNAKLKSSMENLIKVCIPIVQNNPPEALQMYGGELTEARIGEFISGYLEGIWPTAEELFEEMKLTCVIREFTFDTLDSKDFLARLKKAFPKRDWDKPYDAAMAVTAGAVVQ